MAIGSLGGLDSFSIRPAARGDAKALRMLLPPLGDVAAAFVAVDDERQVVIGAAAAARALRQAPFVGPGIGLHVIEPCRRRGVATKLLSHLERAAQTGGAKALYGAKRVDHAGEEFRAWSWLGFQACETVEEHVLPVDQFATRLGPLVDRMRAIGRIPENARVVHLYEADPVPVLQFHLDQMGGDRAELWRKLRGHGPGAFLPRQSRVLLVDNKVKGCILAHRASKESIDIDANIVEPSLRGGWANAWLKLEAFRGSPPGVVEYRFKTFDHYADTRSFTKKLGGRTICTTVLMYRPIGETWSDRSQK